ncbi:MAG: tat (twin-arginine translocation) pathway signal sequence [Lautropia sp.]|nr:tat (twin-arginine translocation) pathway signal sequence [Lautropia sp.]
MQSVTGRVAPVRVVPARASGPGLERGERRTWLKTSGVLMGTLAAGSPLALLAPSLSWALPLQSLSESEGKTLLALGRVLYPHRRLPDAVYALLVKALDEVAGADALKRQLLSEGITALDQAAGGRFLSAKADVQLRCTQAIQGQPFFELVRGQCITALYDNEMSFSLFGYPGPSWQLGGYLQRGFQDLDWLPSPPAEASPPLTDAKVAAPAHRVGG